MEPIVKLAIAIGAGIAAWWAAKAANDYCKEVYGQDLWQLLNSKIRDFCNRVNKWLKDNHSFGAEIIRFSVRELDNFRKNIYRLTAEGINRQNQKKIITTEDMTREELENKLRESGITIDHPKDVNVSELLQQLC